MATTRVFEKRVIFSGYDFSDDNRAKQELLLTLRDELSWEE